jgi:hypothetical protein
MSRHKKASHPSEIVLEVHPDGISEKNPQLNRNTKSFNGAGENTKRKDTGESMA